MNSRKSEAVPTPKLDRGKTHKSLPNQKGVQVGGKESLGRECPPGCRAFKHFLSKPCSPSVAGILLALVRECKLHFIGPLDAHTQIYRQSVNRVTDAKIQSPEGEEENRSGRDESVEIFRLAHDRVLSSFLSSGSSTACDSGDPGQASCFEFGTKLIIQPCL